jgi:hypothetical protein
MSAPGPEAARRVWVLELKAGEAVHPAGGVQLQRWREAVDEIATTHGILRVGADAVLLQGDPTLLLEELGATTPIPR